METKITIEDTTIEKLVLKKLEDIKSLTLIQTKDALNVKEASLFTGLSISFIHKCCHFKQIPYYKGKGNKYNYFHKKELTDWMLHRQIKTQDELESEAVTRSVVGSKNASKTKR